VIKKSALGILDCLIDGIRGANGLEAQDGICPSDPGVRHVPRQLHGHDARDKEQRNSGEEERGDNFGANAPAFRHMNRSSIAKPKFAGFIVPNWSSVGASQS
jgi:hypothetical protein